MKTGDVVYIQGQLRVCQSARKGHNWDFRDFAGGYDYFGEDTPYVFITDKETLRSQVTKEQWLDFAKQMKRYHQKYSDK